MGFCQNHDRLSFVGGPLARRMRGCLENKFFKVWVGLDMKKDSPLRTG